MSVKVRAALWGGILALVAGGFLIGGLQSFAAEAVKDSKAVADRKKTMQANNKLAKEIGEAVKKDEFPKVVFAASEIAENAINIPELFEKKDLTGKTAALPKIWEEKTKFDQRASKLMTDARAVVEAARDKDKAKVEAAVKVMGANCGACHETYRVKKQN